MTLFINDYLENPTFPIIKHFTSFCCLCSPCLWSLGRNKVTSSSFQQMCSAASKFIGSRGPVTVGFLNMEISLINFTVGLREITQNYVFKFATAADVHIWHAVWTIGDLEDEWKDLLNSPYPGDTHILYSNRVIVMYNIFNNNESSLNRFITFEWSKAESNPECSVFMVSISSDQISLT